MRAAWLGVFAIGLGCRAPTATEPSVPPSPLPEPIGVAPAGDNPRAPRASATARPALALPDDAPPPIVAPLLAEVSPERLRETVDRLAAFGTRHTLSAEAPDRGIVAAREWIAAQMHEAAVADRPGGALTVELDVHRIEPDGRRIDRAVDVVNVVAILPGAEPSAARRRYYVIGHYDSRNSDPMDRKGDAPGANDDGSGTAVVLELARVLADQPLESTVVLMATAGEEQGLLGARAHAKAARDGSVDVRAVLSNDIVGDPTAPDGRRLDGQVRVFSEGMPRAASEAEQAAIRSLGADNDAPSRQLARFVDFVGAWHQLSVTAALRFRPDRYLRGGDHTAFNEQGFAAVRLTEMAENYDRQHQDLRREGARDFGDRPEYVDASYLADVARLNLATLVHLANAPSAPPNARVLAAELTTDTTVRWDASPEPDVAGYEVVWRSTTDAQWTSARWVEGSTELTLPYSKDDWQFGVRAVDHDGFRSPVQFATSGTR